MTRTRKARSRRQVAVLLMVLGICVLAPLAAYADPLDGLAQTLSNSGPKWGGALLVLGGLMTGAAIMMGHQQTGEKVQKFIVGAIFLVLAAGGSAFILAKCADLVR